MENAQIPDSIFADADRVIRDAIKHAYEAGYAQGRSDAANSILAAAQGMANATTSASALSVVKRESPAEGAEEREPHPNAAASRRFPYGAIKKAFREAVKRFGSYGLTQDELIVRVSELLGQDVSDMKHRDTLKRMKVANEVRQSNGKYYPGSALSEPNENGAAEAAPDADEVAPSSTAAGQ